jgi:hypothetical protein
LLNILLFSDMKAQTSICGNQDISTMNPADQAAFLQQQVALRALPFDENLKIIPVVVHILYDAAVPATDIADAQVVEAIKELNENYRKTAGTHGAGNGVDVNVEFRLAQLDESGACTTGIIHHAISYTTALYLDLTSGADNFKANSRWNTSKYLNIWVVKEFTTLHPVPFPAGSITTGVAFQPNSTAFNPLSDGVTIRYDYFGRTGTSPNATQTLSHEVGHWLNLFHTHEPGRASNSCTNTDCLLDGDLVCDTPPQQLSNSCNQANTCIESPPVYDLVENYLGYAGACRNMLTAGQKTRCHQSLTVHRATIYSSANLTETGVSDDVIATNTTWGTNKWVNTVTINSGATLTISSGATIRFATEGKMTIKAGGKLVLNGALSGSGSGCSGGWKGVLLEGISTAPQYIGNSTATLNPAQGILQMGTGSIENAELGVNVKAGGILVINGGTFKNCTNGVALAPYGSSNLRSNLCSFENTSFLTDATYLFASPPNIFLKLDGIGHVYVTGCTFKNEYFVAAGGNVLVNYGYGIWANDAGFTVKERPAAGTLPLKYSNFSHLGYAIYTQKTNSNNRCTIQNTVFDDNFNIGIYSKGVSGNRIVHNTFNMGTPKCFACDDGTQIGAFFENNTTGLIFEENVLIDIASNGNTVGTLCKNLGGFNTKIRRNTYQNLQNANIANGVNKGTVLDPTQNSGLSYECNTNTNSQTQDIGIDIGGTIRQKQTGNSASSTVSAANVFTTMTTNTPPGFKHINNQGSGAIDYFYQSSVPTQNPANVFNVNKIITTILNTCPINYAMGVSNNSIEMASMHYAAAYQNYQNQKTVYNALIDGGNTEMMKSEIQAANETWELRNKLIGASPYLTEEVLKKAAEKYQILPNALLMEVLLANPDATKSEELYEYLRNKPNPLSESMIDLIKNSNDVVTFRSNLENSMVSLQAEMDQAVLIAVQEITAAPDSLHHADLRGWLGNLRNVAADLEIIHDFIATNDIAAANALLQSLPQTYNLDSDRLAEVQNYTALLNILMGMNVEDRLNHRFDTTTIASIEQIAQSADGMAKTFAQNLLSTQGYYFAPKYTIPTLGVAQRVAKPKSSKTNNPPISISLAPNPATDYVVVAWDMTVYNANATLLIMDVLGNIVQTVELTNPTGSWVWDTRAVANGLYFYTLHDGRRIVESGKITVIKK